jgi:hypothetical protein
MNPRYEIIYLQGSMPVNRVRKKVYKSNCEELFSYGVQPHSLLAVFYAYESH